jgi:hypothetical protein
VDPKATHVGPDDRQIFLELIGHARFTHRSTTPGAVRGQRYVNRLVNLPRRPAMPVPAVLPARAPARPARMGGRGPFGERGRRPLRRTSSRVQFLLQVVNFLPKPGVLASQPIPLTLQTRNLTVFVRNARRWPPVVLATHTPVMPESPQQYKRDPLTNYVRSSKFKGRS